ncbi:MAG: LysM domain-containing protein [Pseudomonadota bacterium]|nr:LysM domain-containing protein [Pseudomonadota bacterium]
MFEPTSRYFDLETTTLKLPDGREVRYVRRRFLPPAATGTVFAEHTVSEGERLDHITARYLGDPELFWQLADINNAMEPDELTAEIGRKLRVSLLPV